ncbi:MAG: hypothetical protein H6620_05985 [Halobacteriovoraceae bacterium]|nr:hypothetical protein [Halobacteriovoraceae bacterium]
MTSSVNNYPAKILLFGEYSILCESQALAFPYFAFKGKALYLNSQHHYFHNLQGLVSYLKAYYKRHAIEAFLDLDRFEEALKDNWAFDSNIPHGYGIGSSGALCAAIYDQFKVSFTEESDLRKRLAIMESYFHSTSSGIDPYISLNKRNYLLNNKSLEEVPNFREIFRKYRDQSVGFYLVDSGFSRQASPFIELFKENLQDKDYHNYMVTEYRSLNDHCIESFMSASVSDFKDNYLKLCEVQHNVFSEMMFSEITKENESLLKEQKGGIKLCGAGGGGFYLMVVFDSINFNEKNCSLDLIKIDEEYIL